jgi:hypothetical protein
MNPESNGEAVVVAMPPPDDGNVGERHTSRGSDGQVSAPQTQQVQPSQTTVKMQGTAVVFRVRDCSSR